MTALRALTPEGMEEAGRRLGLLRTGRLSLDGLGDLLERDRWSRVFDADITIRDVPLRTRREAAEYLSETLGPARGRVALHQGVWSFLGMFFLMHSPEDSGEVRVSPLDSCYLFDVGPRATQKRNRHYLWGAWQLYRQHGEAAAFLLDQRLTSWTDMAERAFGSLRVFNSRGVVPLMQRLYFRGGKQRRGANGRAGGVRHLLRVLSQLERTHDVYGDMTPGAILKILPQEFRDWDDHEPG